MRALLIPCGVTLALLAPLHAQTAEVPGDTLVVTLPAPPASEAEPGNVAGGQPGAVPNGAGVRRGLLWRASTLRNSVYLLGSIHLASREFYPLPGHVEQAFEKSNVLVVEVNLNQLDQAKFQGLLAANGLYPREDSLWNHISEDTRELVDSFCRQHGLDPEGVGRMKPWLAAFAISFLPAAATVQELAPGIDKHFLDEAGDRMRIEPLESPEDQFRIESHMPGAEQERNLRSAVRNAGQSVDDFQKLQTLWLEGDAEKLEAYLAASMRDDPEYEKRVFADRNPPMAERAEQCLKSSDRCFIVVGAGHMVGKDGVVQLLRERGYQVEQVLAPQ